MIKESAVYHFIDKGNQYALTIFNGGQFMQELSQWQNFGTNEIKALRPLILSLQCLLTVIKNNESFGAYINDSENSFRFNMESHANGDSRLLLKSQAVPNSKIDGLCKFVKFQPNDNAPYTSILELKQTPLKEVVSNIITQSYQFDAHVEVFEENDLGIILTKFPHVKEPLKSVAPLEDIYTNVIASFSTEISEEEVINAIAKNGFTFLSMKRVTLKCRCTRDKLIITFRNLDPDNLDEIFQKDPEVEVNCDYCSKGFKITRKDLQIQ